MSVFLVSRHELKHFLYPHFSFFFFNATPTTEIYTLSLHDALPILVRMAETMTASGMAEPRKTKGIRPEFIPTRSESTRLNSSHLGISYAVFCLKKKKKKYKKQ